MKEVKSRWETKYSYFHMIFLDFTMELDVNLSAM